MDLLAIYKEADVLRGLSAGQLQRIVPLARRVVLAERIDTGKAIPPRELPRIFDDYYRGSEDSTGRGLGLSIVKRIIEAHGGCLWAESPPADGSDENGTNVASILPISASESEDRRGH